MSCRLFHLLTVLTVGQGFNLYSNGYNHFQFGVTFIKPLKRLLIID